MTQTIARIFENKKNGATVKISADMGFGKESAGYYIEVFSNDASVVLANLKNEMEAYDKHDDEYAYYQEECEKLKKIMADKKSYKNIVWMTDEPNSIDFEERYFSTKTEAIEYALGQSC